jgi:hypothetical protein
LIGIEILLNSSPFVVVSMLKRGANASNVTASRSKMSRQIGKVVAGEKAVEFRNDLESLTQQLKSDPKKMKAIKAVMKSDAEPSFDAKTEFPPDIACSTILKTPARFLTENFFTKFATEKVSKQVLQALLRRDRTFATKLFQKAAVLDKGAKFGPQDKTEWISLFTDRCQRMGFKLDELVYDSTFEIDWSACGLYTFLPELTDGSPADHKFTHVRFLNRHIELSSDITIRGNWKINFNWDFRAASVYDPEHSWRREPCFSMISPPVITEMIPPMILPGAKTLAITDDPAMHELKDTSDASSIKSAPDYDTTPQPSPEKSEAASSCAASQVPSASEPPPADVVARIRTPGMRKPPSKSSTRSAQVQAAIMATVVEPPKE